MLPVKPTPPSLQRRNFKLLQLLQQLINAFTPSQTTPLQLLNICSALPSTTSHSVSCFSCIPETWHKFMHTQRDYFYPHFSLTILSPPSPCLKVICFKLDCKAVKRRHPIFTSFTVVQHYEYMTLSEAFKDNNLRLQWQDLNENYWTSIHKQRK